MLTPEQDRIHRDLKELVSTGIADIYCGACEIRNNEPKLPLAAMTVAHYLREVESALRAVLTPYVPPGTRKKDKGCAGGHDASINTVLAVIGVDENDPNVAMWRRFSDRDDPQHLTAYAHRNGLDATRAFDDAFKAACASFDTLLTFVLGRVRASATRLTQNLKMLLAIPTPTANDVKVLRNNVPAAPFMFDRIFDAPLNQLWIDELLTAGFFAEPPPGSATIVAMFAMNLVASDPGHARSILQQLPAIDDAFMANAYVETMRRLGDADPLLVAKALNWVQRPVFATSVFPRFPQFNKLIIHLGACSDTTSALAFVEALTVVNPPKETTNPFFRDPETLLETDEYDEVIVAGIDALATRAAVDLIKLLCDRLEAALAVSFRDRSPSPSGLEDVSEAWLATFNGPDASLFSLKHILTKRLADALVSAADADPASVPALAAQLRARSYRVFRRLEAQLLLHAHASTDAADEMVTDPSNYWSIAPQAEFSELLRRRFPHLNDVQKQTVLEAITTDLDRASINEDASDDGYRELKERRVQNYLTLLSGYLPDAYSERLSEIAARQGPSTDLALPVPESRPTLAPESPWETEEFRSFTLSDIFAALSSRPYAYGAATQLREAVEVAPTQFDRGLSELESLAPGYVRAIITGFAYTLRTGKAFDWSLVLAFCQRVLVRPDADRIVVGDLGNEWSALRTEIANLITDGANGTFRVFDESMRETVIAIIDRILVDEVSPPNEPSELDGQLTRSLVEPHAAAMRALVWVIYRFRDPDDHRPLVDRDGIRCQSDGAALLERFLALPDTTVHVHAGERFDFFCRLDLPWARAAVPLIFPTSENPERAQRAAWETFITVCPAKFYSYDELKEQYALAARAWPIEEAKTGTPDFSYPNALARHILALYLHGRLSLGDLNPLYARLSDKATAHAMFRLADYAANADSGFGEEELARFLSFWSWRKGQIANAADAHIEELKSFGAWFCTLELPEPSGLDELKAVLAITGGAIEPAHRIMKCMSEVSDDGLEGALACVLALVDGDAAANNVYFWRDDIRDILSRARGSDEATLTLARTIAGHLTVKRLQGFEKLF